MAFRNLVPLLVVPLGIALDARAVSVVTEVPLPTPASHALNIGQGGYDLWITEYDANKLARIVCTGFNACSGLALEVGVPTPDSGPEGITPFSDALGNLGFTEFKANKIGRVDPSGKVTEFSVPTPNAGPRGIVVGGNQSLWFTEFAANKIGVLSFQGVFTEYPIETPSSGPLAITQGPTGIACCNSDIWFTEFAANKIGRLGENGLTEYAIPTPDSGPSGITEGQIGSSDTEAVWFTELNANKIGRITADGKIQEFSIPTPDSGPLGVSFGPGGLWFTESRVNKIGRVNPGGTVSEFSIPTTNSMPAGLRGTWFVESAGNRIGHIEEDWLVAVGSGHAGAWNTELDLANGRGATVTARVGRRGPQICGLCFDPTLATDIPALGARRVSATDVPFVGEGFDTFLVTTGLTPEDDLPTTRARILNRARPSQSAEIPVVRYSTIRRLNPSVLTFPSATRNVEAHTNLVLAEVSAGEGEVQVIVEAYSADGELEGRSRPMILSGAQTIVFGDVLAMLGIGDLEGGQIRVTKLSGNGLMWGLLATAYDDGRLLVSAGLNP
ncbi:MAG TPA: hypothetical protein VKE50_07100 [Thermoanaerobaculia bacterium]|nr:hypothetical protein [Thermoanaerobaculia bacterium]